MAAFGRLKIRVASLRSASACAPVAGLDAAREARLAFAAFVAVRCGLGGRAGRAGRCASGAPSMRTPGAKLVVFEAIRAMRGRFGFRIVEFAVMQTFSKHPPPTQRATYMALQCARRFLIELDDKPMPPPPLPDRRKRRRLFNVVQPAT